MIINEISCRNPASPVIVVQTKNPIPVPKSEIKKIPLHMAYKEREISKMYYTMGEVSAMFDVNQSLIRFYEKEFDVLQPKKNKKGNRYFTPEDIENFKIIFHLIRDKGYTLNGAKEHLKSNLGDHKENQRVIDSLENIKKFLLEVRDQL
jgi:DNA-binding transcriptional MerR regulator